MGDYDHHCCFAPLPPPVPLPVQSLVVTPCFNVAPGANVTLAASKAVVALQGSGAVLVSAPIVDAFTAANASVPAAPTSGVRQVAAVNATAGWWLSGQGSPVGGGYRYLASLSATTTTVVSGLINCTGAPNASACAARVEPGAADARGVLTRGGQLLGSDSAADAGFGGACVGGVPPPARRCCRE